MLDIKYKETPNQYELWGDIEAIILHTTLGEYNGAIEWLRMTPEERQRRTGVKSYSSAHYVISRLGEITQLAKLDRGTWHAGAVSSPTDRAKKVLPTDFLGRLKNPNRYTIGIEFASGYDIDRDGLLETWEKLYTPQQVKAAAELIKEVIEPELGRKFSDDRILTHKDVTSYKPDLEVQRTMVLGALKSHENKAAEPEPTPEPAPQETIIELARGEKLEIELLGRKAIARKVT